VAQQGIEPRPSVALRQAYASAGERWPCRGVTSAFWILRHQPSDRTNAHQTAPMSVFSSDQCVRAFDPPAARRPKNRCSSLYEHGCVAHSPARAAEILWLTTIFIFFSFFFVFFCVVKFKHGSAASIETMGPPPGTAVIDERLSRGQPWRQLRRNDGDSPGQGGFESLIQVPAMRQRTCHGGL